MKSYCVKQKKVTECVPGSERYSADQKYASQKTRLKRAQENCAHASAFVTRASKTRLHQR